MNNTLDVLVVGAGPTGLTLACDLLRRGVRVRVIDAAEQGFTRLARQRSPATHPRGLR